MRDVLGVVVGELLDLRSKGIFMCLIHFGCLFFIPLTHVAAEVCVGGFFSRESAPRPPEHAGFEGGCVCVCVCVVQIHISVYFFCLPALSLFGTLL